MILITNMDYLIGYLKAGDSVWFKGFNVHNQSKSYYRTHLSWALVLAEASHFIQDKKKESLGRGENRILAMTFALKEHYRLI